MHTWPSYTASSLAFDNANRRGPSCPVNGKTTTVALLDVSSLPCETTESILDVVQAILWVVHLRSTVQLIIDGVTRGEAWWSVESAYHHQNSPSASPNLWGGGP